MNLYKEYLRNNIFILKIFFKLIPYIYLIYINNEIK